MDGTARRHVPGGPEDTDAIARVEDSPRPRDKPRIIVFDEKSARRHAPLPEKVRQQRQGHEDGRDDDDHRKQHECQNRLAVQRTAEA